MSCNYLIISNAVRKAVSRPLGVNLRFLSTILPTFTHCSTEEDEKIMCIGP